MYLTPVILRTSTNLQFQAMGVLLWQRHRQRDLSETGRHGCRSRQVAGRCQLSVGKSVTNPVLCDILAISKIPSQFVVSVFCVKWDILGQDSGWLAVIYQSPYPVFLPTLPDAWKDLSAQRSGSCLFVPACKEFVHIIKTFSLSFVQFVQCRMELWCWLAQFRYKRKSVIRYGLIQKEADCFGNGKSHGGKNSFSLILQLFWNSALYNYLLMIFAHA